jgi:hypothetical protein
MDDSQRSKMKIKLIMTFLLVWHTWLDRYIDSIMAGETMLRGYLYLLWGVNLQFSQFHSQGFWWVGLYLFEILHPIICTVIIGIIIACRVCKYRTEIDTTRSQKYQASSYPKGEAYADKNEFHESGSIERNQKYNSNHKIQVLHGLRIMYKK